MADAMVLMAQQWVNRTYGSVPMYQAIPETGKTGWSTMYALTRALQRELGITTLADSFGPGTQNALTALGPITPGYTGNANIVRILQCGLYCAGYNGGVVVEKTWTDLNGVKTGVLEPNGVYDASLAKGVTAINTDMGLGGGTAVTTKIFKGVLTMNAYVRVGSGLDAVREVQQWLNGKYVSSRQNFFVIPCDGLFSRDVQKALVYAIQYEQGMNDATANGSYGPATQSGLKLAAAQPRQGTVDTTKSFVRLFQAALRFNGKTVGFNGTFDAGTTNATTSFQSFAKLNASGYADFATWSSLLVSTGDPTRPGSGCDTITMIDDAKASALKAAGYTTVGRYLANYPGSKTNKKIQPGEIATMFRNGLAFWPIYQMANDSISEITFASGSQDGSGAHTAAVGYGLPTGSILYFAIDFDATQEQTLSNVIPYFQGVQQALRSAGGKYRVGVYGSRNVCSLVSIYGGAVSSMVSGMSTGFSGNLGFPLPNNWALDQIQTLTVGSGTGAIEIDKDVMRGAPFDTGIRTLEAPTGNEACFAWLRNLRATAAEYIKTGNAGITDPDILMVNYIRGTEPGYDGTSFAGLIGEGIDTGFKSHAQSVGFDACPPLIDPDSGITVDVEHMMCPLEGVLVGQTSPIPDKSLSYRADILGWAGDLLSVWHSYYDGHADEQVYDYFTRTIGSVYDPCPKFGPGDLIGDVDGVTIALALHIGAANGAPTTVCDQIEAIYGTAGRWRTRYTDFFNRRFGGSWDAALSATRDVFYGMDPGILAARLRIYQLEKVQDMTGPNLDDAALAFVEVLRRRVALEK